jgi:solute carrier family 29 (equilibrative nucleoside transporter), member 4
VSGNRILTKLLFDDQRANTTLFFGLSLLTVTICSALHSIVRESDFVNYYIALCDASASNNRIVLEPAEDMGLVNILQARLWNHMELTIYKFISDGPSRAAK